jgi:protein AaeX
MFREFTLFAFLVPGLLLVLVACVPVFIGIDLVLARTGLYERVWHPALFRASLFVALLCAAARITR